MTEVLKRKLLIITDLADSNLQEYKKKYLYLNNKKINDDEAVSIILENLKGEVKNGKA